MIIKEPKLLGTKPEFYAFNETVYSVFSFVDGERLAIYTRWLDYLDDYNFFNATNIIQVEVKPFFNESMDAVFNLVAVEYSYPKAVETNADFLTLQEFVRKTMNEPKFIKKVMKEANHEL